MMRSILFGAFVAAVVCVAAGTAEAKKNGGEKKPELKTVVVTGYGEKPQSARANAMREAQDVVEKALRNELAEDGWAVPRGPLAPKHLEERGVLKEVEEPKVDPDANGAWRSRYQVTLTPPRYLQEVRKQAREEWVAQEKQERGERAAGRQVLLLRILGGAVALLLVVAGYLRMEEATRGYCTHLLRAGAVTLLALAAAALWLTA